MAKQTMKEMLAEGTIGLAYGKSTFIRIKPAYSIGKINFSIVKQDTAGKEHLDFYLDVDLMRKLVLEIEKGAFAKKYNDETKQPCYIWRTGKDGCKTLSFSKGKAGIMINIFNNENNEQKKMMAVYSLDEFETMIFLFKLTSGLIPLAQPSYYYSLLEAFNQSQEKNTFKLSASDMDENEQPTFKTATKVLSLETTGVIKKAGEDIKFGVRDVDTDEEYELTFTASKQNELEWFKAFGKYVKENKVKQIKANVVAIGTNLTFLNLVK